jgi:hypothetical protein
MKEFLREYPQSFFDLGDTLLKKSLGFIRNHLVLKILWRHRCLYTSLLPVEGDDATEFFQELFQVR